MSLDDTFAALADPTRRKAVAMLLERPRRAGELADALDQSAPSMSRHLRVLRQSGLVSLRFDEADARARTYELKQDRFVELHDWLADYERFWSGQLAAFAAYAEKKKKGRAKR